MDVTHVSREMILPSPLSTPHVVTLSNIDQVMPRYYTGFFYFFTPSSAGEVNTETVTSSLARALAAFPPVAGRLKAMSNGGMDVDCNNQGAIFVEANTTAKLQDFQTIGDDHQNGGSGGFQPGPLWKSLVPDPYKEDQQLTEKPLLFTQLTRFACGGVAIGIRLLHLLADGAAQSHFLSSWAELARGAEISVSPHLDRSLLQARTPPCTSFEHIEYKVQKELPTPLYSAYQQLPPMTSKIFEFLPQDVQALIERANADTGKTSFTGFQALAGHVWKHVTKARGIAHSIDTKLGFAADGRKRFDQPLPPTYFGNVSFYACSESNVGELIAKPLHYAATCVQTATHRITDEYMRSALAFIDQQESPLHVTPSFMSPSELSILSWVRFKSYNDVDFGWGNPSFLECLHTSSLGL